MCFRTSKRCEPWWHRLPVRSSRSTSRCSARFSEARANAAAWEGAVADAEAGLEDAGLSAAEAQGIRKQLASVETDLRRLERPAAGLAAFHDRTGLHALSRFRRSRSAA